MNTFKEEQRFTTLWVWIPVGSIAVLALAGLVAQLGFHISVGNRPVSNTGMVLISLIPFGLALYFYRVRMKTTYDNKGITVHYPPFSPHTVLWGDIRQAEVITYSFVGYGLRQSGKYGTVYNIRGNQGLFIVTDKERFLIGTSQPEKVKEVLTHWMKRRGSDQ